MGMSGRQQILAWSLSMSSVLIPATGMALDLSITPRVNTGVLYYEFERDPITNTQVFALPTPSGGLLAQSQATSTTNSGFKISAVMPFVGGGLTLFADRLFLDIYAQGAFSGEDDFTQTVTQQRNISFPTVPSLDEPNVLTQSLRSNAKFDRQEYSLTAGMAVTENVAVFAGYRLSAVNFEFDLSGTQTEETLSGVFPSDIAPFKQEVDFDQNGFFFGSALGMDVLPDRAYGGFVTLNVAIAFLDGELTGANRDVATGAVTPFAKQKGDTVGVNVGLSWNGDIPTVKGLGYTIGLDGYTYAFGNTDPASGASDFSETVGRFTAGLSYSF